MEPTEILLPGLVMLFVLGTATQWIAWCIKIPAILLLLAVGSLYGSIPAFTQPNEVFGALLLPIVSLSVGLILFEGGLNLRFVELKQTWRSLVGLLTIGVLVTWILVAIAAKFILGLNWDGAILLGSVLVVTGPTVIGPLLRDIRPTGRVSAIAKWEGIVIDPVGATLAVLVFNALRPLLSGQLHSVAWSMAIGMVMTLLVGLVCGVVAAVILYLLMRRFLLPDYLQNPMTLTLVLGSFAAANKMQAESGLLAVTVMGVVLANLKRIDISKIVEFKESIATLLISTLFIILASQVPLQSLANLGWRGPAFAIALILIVRPLAVWLSTIRSGLTFSERAFLAWFAPRGIVAAAVTSVFALRLGEAGAGMIPATFYVIFATVATYGLTAPILARRLGLAVADAQGLLIVGANKTAREIASILKTQNFNVTMVDTQFPRIRKANQAGLRACFANVLSEEVLDLVDFGGIGKFLAMTANDQVNTLATVRFRELFGSSNVYQLKSNEVRPSYLETRWQNHIAGRPLFHQDLTHEFLNTLIEQGAKLYVVSADQFMEKPAAKNDEAMLPMKESLRNPQANAIDESTAASIAGPLKAFANVVTEMTEDEAVARKGKKEEEHLTHWPLFIIDGKKLTVCTADSKQTYRASQKVVVLSKFELEDNLTLPPKTKASSSETKNAVLA